MKLYLGIVAAVFWVCFVSCSEKSSEKSSKPAISTPLIQKLTTKLEENPHDTKSLSERGFAYAMVGEEEAADADFRKALYLAPEDKRIRWSYGWALFNLDRSEEAIPCWKRVIAERSEATWWEHHTLAMGYWKVGKKEEALECFDRATKANPSYFGDWENLTKYTSFWTWKEKQCIYQIFDAWKRAY